MLQSEERLDTALIAALEDRHYQPLWDRFRKLTPINPDAKDKAFLWPWREIEPLTVRAGKEVAMEDAERRAVIMCNPELDGRIVTTTNLISAFTILEPGDKALPHRHTAAAIRFGTNSDGAVTFVNGRRCEMKEGDLILTPPMCWHGHINEGDRRTTWFDAANIPLINSLDVSFFESVDSDNSDFWKADEGEERVWEGSGLMATDVDHNMTHSPKYHYPGNTTQSTLDAMKPTTDGRKILRYVNPLTGGSVMTTLDCYYMRMTQNAATQPRRGTYNQICLVTKGQGCSTVGDETFDWSQYDTFSIPHWTWVNHKAISGDAEFFIVTDRSLFENLDLIREETAK